MNLTLKSKLPHLLAALVLTASTSLAIAQTAAPTTAPTSQPATQPGFSNITAVINGEVLSRDDFQRVLDQVAGPKVFEELLSLVLVQKACQDAGIVVGSDQVKGEINKIISSLREQGTPEDQMDRAINYIIQREGLSPVEFQIALQTKACLSALSKNHGEVSDDQLETAFKQETGRQFRIVDIIADFAQASELRKTLEKDNLPILEAAHKLNLPTRTIVVSEFTPDTEFPKTILDVVKKLKEKELSVLVPLFKENQTESHMAYLDKLIPPTEVKPADVVAYKAKLKEKLSLINQEQWGQQHLANLKSKARIDIKDPVLAQIFKNIMAARAASSQPAPAAPAAAPTNK